MEIKIYDRNVRVLSPHMFEKFGKKCTLFQCCKLIHRGDYVERDDTTLQHFVSLLMERNPTREMINFTLEFYHEKGMKRTLLSTLKRFIHIIGGDDACIFVMHRGYFDELCTDSYEILFMVDIFRSSNSYRARCIDLLCSVCRDEKFLSLVNDLANHDRITIDQVMSCHFSRDGNAWDNIGFLLSRLIKVKHHVESFLLIGMKGSGQFTFLLSQLYQCKYNTLTLTYINILKSHPCTDCLTELISSYNDLLLGRDTLAPNEILNEGLNRSELESELFHFIGKIDHEKNIPLTISLYKMYKLNGMMREYLPNLHQMILHYRGNDEKAIYMRAKDQLKQGNPMKAISLLEGTKDERARGFLACLYSRYQKRKSFDTQHLKCGKYLYKKAETISDLKRSIDLGYHKGMDRILAAASVWGAVGRNDLVHYHEKCLHLREGLSTTIDRNERKREGSPILEYLSRSMSYSLGPDAKLLTTDGFTLMPLSFARLYFSSYETDQVFDLMELEDGIDEGIHPLIRHIMTGHIEERPTRNLFKLAARLKMDQFMKDSLPMFPLEEAYLLLADVNRDDLFNSHQMFQLHSKILSSSFILPEGREFDFVKTLSREEDALVPTLKCVTTLMLMHWERRVAEKEEYDNLIESLKKRSLNLIVDCETIGSGLCAMLMGYGFLINVADPVRESLTDCIVWREIRVGETLDILKPILRVELVADTDQPFRTHRIILRRRRGVRISLGISISIRTLSASVQYRYTTLDMNESVVKSVPFCCHGEEPLESVQLYMACTKN